MFKQLIVLIITALIASPLSAQALDVRQGEKVKIASEFGVPAIVRVDESFIYTAYLSGRKCVIDRFEKSSYKMLKRQKIDAFKKIGANFPVSSFTDGDFLYYLVRTRGPKDSI